MSYLNYVNEIKLELMRMGVDPDVAYAKAKCCRGLYTDEKKYVPVKDAIIFCIRRMPLLDFSISGLKMIRKDYKIRVSEISDFLKTCKRGVKDTGKERMYEWGDCA